jgi:peptidoglycan LD-endopeptidase LytH
VALATARPAESQIQLPPLLPTPGATPLLPPLLPGILTPPTASPGADPSPKPSVQGPQGPAVVSSDTDEYARCGAPPPPIPRGRRSAPRNTNRLVALAQPLVERGVPLDQAMIALAPPFPVAGKANFTDDWGNARSTPCPHWHQGTDIFAAFGTPIVASGPGVVNARGHHAVGGLSVWVTGDDKMSFYYAHLERFSDVRPGDRVEAGTVLGYVGDTGNAEGGSPHLHFSIHPPTRRTHGVVSSGSGTLGRSLTPYANPKPYLDSWLDSAETRAPRVIELLNKRLDEDPSSAARLVSLLRPADLAGFGEAPGMGPFGLPWSRLGLAAAVLGLVAIVHAAVTIGRTSRAGRRGPAEEAGAPGPWTPSWALKTPEGKRGRRGRRSPPSSGAWVQSGRTAQPSLRRQNYSSPERPPTAR